MLIISEFNSLKLAVTAAFALISTSLGWMGWLVMLYVICMAADWVSGSAVACMHASWSSSIARAGLWHKGGSVLAILVSAAADWLLGTVINNIPQISLPFSYSVLICPVVIIWYILTELGSIIENAGAMGAPIPAFLTRMLSALKTSVDDSGDDW